MMKKYKVKIKSKNHPTVEQAVSVWKKEKNGKTDVLGSYTGVPSANSDLVPEQDSDDL